MKKQIRLINNQVYSFTVLYSRLLLLEIRMRQEIIDLYDEFTHAPLDRRVFLQRLAALVGGTAAASALLPLLENNYA
jgi:hypothetical protein